MQWEAVNVFFIISGEWVLFSGLIYASMQSFRAECRVTSNKSDVQRALEYVAFWPAQVVDITRMVLLQKKSVGWTKDVGLVDSRLTKKKEQCRGKIVDA